MSPKIQFLRCFFIDDGVCRFAGKRTMHECDAVFVLVTKLVHLEMHCPAQVLRSLL